MASCVHYMFKSSTNYDTISFDGLSISNAELKSMIITQKKLGRSLEFDLLLTNAQTKEGEF
jgi:E3 ubiquitin-protein ligase RBBP6